MAMETLLKQLESKIDELVETYEASRTRVVELEERVAELEGRLGNLAEAESRTSSLEGQRQAVAERLHRVVATIDRALGAQQDDEPEA